MKIDNKNDKLEIEEGRKAMGKYHMCNRDKNIAQDLSTFAHMYISTMCTSENGDVSIRPKCMC